MTEPERTSVTVRIPPYLRRRLVDLAAARGVSLNRVIAECLSLELDRDGPTPGPPEGEPEGQSEGGSDGN